MSRFGNSSDPRVQRTRQLLLDAFMALVQEKHTIHSISIQEIAMRATVNRATFYAHFEDKYALFVDWSREKFQRGLVCQFPASSLQRDLAPADFGRIRLYGALASVFQAIQSAV